MSTLLTLATLFAAVLATSRTSAPSGCITAGSGGTYSTIQEAVDSLSTTSTTAQCIFIEAGSYNEQVTVSAREAELTFYGYTEDTSTYSSNVVTITNDLSAASGLSDEETGTLIVLATNFKMYNINVANTYGDGSQAIALSAYADSGYYACQFTGFQDTVLAEEGYQLYAGCLIEGATDFVFGQYSPAWFQSCDIRVLEASVGYVTANGRTSSTGTSYYVFNECDIAAADGESVASGAYYLGRPWSEYARVVFQDTTMSDVINSAGWAEWSSSEPNTEDVLFGEYDNTGDGAEGTRASFATKLSAAVSIETILGDDYTSAGYYDASYM
ncbi:family 8 carbohydrate esterase [Cryphonectria parasitica EP155]|uniref:Pectinesterase n=1 Tax=Cryphonectria parasitica (strain ATCC 38755 / EP155) TaxID=660469 RepID=A0A9P4XSG0_CRYP1|nr:family 8 carbohydrate esterase [Cryphonectria parasitica EP155]KAF3760479.1 family 8 carbohydrate esterase [Cryphonectria parasitica EP155]